MSPKPPTPINTPLAVEVPPLELTPDQAYQLLLDSDPATISDPDFEKLVTAYREKRQKMASAVLARKMRKKAEKPS